MSDITSWERSAANNNSSPPDGAPEGMAPSTVNNTMREMMAAVARNRRQYTGTDSGTDAYQFDGNGDLATGDVVEIDIGSANTTASPTLENTGGAPAGAQSIFDVDGNARIGMLEARPHRFQYDGTNYVLMDPQPLRPSTTSSDPGLALDAWRTPNSSRPVLVVVSARARTDGSTPGNVRLYVDESGGTSVDYSLEIAWAEDKIGAAGEAKGTVTTIIPPGGSYRIDNTFDPSGVNSIEVHQEFIL